MTFSEILDEYIELKFKEKSDYYSNRYVGDRLRDNYRLKDLKEKLDTVKVCTSND